MNNDGKNNFSFKRTFLGAVYMGVFICIVGLSFNSLQKNSLPLDHTKIMEQKSSPEIINKISGTHHKTSCEPYPIFTEQLKEMYDAGSVTIIDARIENEFKTGHIKGSINIPVDKVMYKFKDLQPSLPIDGIYVFYCGSSECDIAMEVARFFCMNGYQDGKILVYQDGYDAWRDAGYPVEP